MAEACDDRVDALVDHLAGRLDSDADSALLAHVATCAGCHEELRALSGPADALRRYAPDAAEDAHPSPALEDRIAAAIAAAPAGGAAVAAPPRPASLDAARSRRRRRFATAMVIVAAAAVVVAIVADVAFGHQATLTGEHVALQGKDSPASAEAVLAPRSFGTQLHIEATGLEPGEVYALWLADSADTKVPAGTFRAGTDGTITGEGRSSLPRDKAVRVWITDPSGATVAVAPLA
jgi:anti-sigma-K factor RskA